MYRKNTFRKKKIFNNIINKNHVVVSPPTGEIEVVDGKGFNNFDIVYYINLEHRKDRLEQITTELKKTNIDESKINRIEAVNLPEFGQLGCTKSHILALEAFLRTPPNITNCLILEDDFEFILDQTLINNFINYFFKYFGNYNVLMLAANIFQNNNSHHPFVNRIYEAKTTAGYCVNKNYARRLLYNYKMSAFMLSRTKLVVKFAIDSHISILQKTGLWYSFNPKIAKQRASYSDIEKNHMKYDC